MNRPRYYKKKLRAKRKNKEYENGIYKPINEEKYRQPFDRTMNKNKYPEYRSSWEKKFYKYLDLSDEVEFWGTEIMYIPYVSPLDMRIHRYFPDVFVKFKNGNKYVIEIKPKTKIKDDVNQAKFMAAKKYCESKGIKFLVLTERELKKMGVL